MIILSAAASLALAITLGITWSGRDMPQDGELATSSQSESVLQRNDELQRNDQAPPVIHRKEKLEEQIVEVLAEIACGPDLSLERRDPGLTAGGWKLGTR